MPFPKPVQVQGGWQVKDSPTTEQRDPVEMLRSIPRSAAGVVTDTGDILDRAGKPIGKITESGESSDLVGSAVMASGDILDSSGKVLAKANLDSEELGEQEGEEGEEGDEGEESEYTTGAKDQKSGGWNLMGKTKSAYQTASNLQKPVSQGLDLVSRMQKPSEDEQSSADSSIQVGDQDKQLQERGMEAGDQEKLKEEAPIAMEDKSEAGKELEGTEAPQPEEAKEGEMPEPDTKDLEEKKSEVAEEGEKLQEEEPIDFSMLKGMKVNKAGKLVNKDGDVVGILLEGDAKQLIGKQSDEEGNIWNDSGKIIGKCRPLNHTERGDEKEFAPFENFPDAVVEADGRVMYNGQQVGVVVEGDAKHLKGSKVDEDGDILDRRGNVVGKAESWDQQEEEPIDYSELKGTKVNKAGKLVNKNGDILGVLIEGDAKQLIGMKSDEEGNIWNDAGKIVGKCRPLTHGERGDEKEFAPFENFPDAVVEADGRVMFEGRQVGVVVDGDPKHLKGSKVDEDGDILDRRGNVVGKAEAWDEPEPEPEAVVDMSSLAGKRVNKAGNIVDGSGAIYGRVIEGNVKSLVGRMCDKNGNILSESGDIIGKAELVGEGEREGVKEGIFAELSGCTVAKDGTVVTPSGDIVGRLTEGDPKKLFGRAVDEDGDIVDGNGNVLGKAERWEEPEAPEKKKAPYAGRKVNREGNVLDEEGNLIAKLVSGDVAACSGKEVDEDGDVINYKGNTVGHVALLEDIPKETEEDIKKREEAENDRKLAGKLAGCIEQSLDKMRPICKMITDKINTAERTPKEELDEEALVREVKPLIEEGAKILTETNGTIRGLDPDGRIQRNAKHKAGTKEATPEEHHLAEVLSELTGTVTQTIDNAKSKIEGMPHAKKELNPLWGLLAEPLFQIIAAVGLLLNGVLGLVGKLLSGLGLGGIVDNLLGTLGLNRVLDSLGLGSITGVITGKDKKEKKKGGGLLGLGIGG
ncbi:uncharacterized protein TrAFT101_008077 [Trichoderma asperellum]|nr:hypothetical protein TrAFT101_008077 [Trichoderma asperellum]